MKYVPVLRYRQEERKSLLSVPLTSKTVPLIELVTDKLRSNSLKSLVEQFVDDLPQIAPTVFVDFPTYIPMRTGTNQQVAAFLRPIISNHSLRVPLFKSLAGQNITPVVTYNPQLSTYINNTVTQEASRLRPSFERLAFRIFINHATQAIAEVGTVARQNDVVIFDIGEDPHTNPGFGNLYSAISSLKANGIVTVIVRSAIPTSVTNSGLVSGQVITSADNSLLTTYSTYGFDAFGDYAGLKRDELTGGGTISPGFIYYSWHNNSFYGYNTPIKQLVEFEKTITPTVLGSVPWGQYTGSHHTSCIGCKEILSISKGLSSGQSQAKWKGITCSHYLCTMEEFL